MKVSFVPVTDYAAVVEALATTQDRHGWLGGFTFVQASLRKGHRGAAELQQAETPGSTSKFITPAGHQRGFADLKQDLRLRARRRPPRAT